MPQRNRAGFVVIVVLTAMAGCGAPSAVLKDDQTVKLTDDSPIYALVLEPQPMDGYKLNIDVTADQPVDFAFMGGERHGRGSRRREATRPRDRAGVPLDGQDPHVRVDPRGLGTIRP